MAGVKVKGMLPEERLKEESMVSRMVKAKGARKPQPGIILRPASAKVPRGK